MLPSYHPMLPSSPPSASSRSRPATPTPTPTPNPNPTPDPAPAPNQAGDTPSDGGILGPLAIACAIFGLIVIVVTLFKSVYSVDLVMQKKPVGTGF